MPPRAKKTEAEPAAEPSEAIQVDRPDHLADLCGECGADENGGGEPADSATSFACEHGSWQFPRAAVDKSAE